MKLIAIVSGAVILQIANGVLGVLVPLEMGLMDQSTAVIGMVVTAYALGFLTGSAFTVSFVRPVGHIRAFAALAAVLSVATILFTTSESPLLWAALRFVTGACLAGIFSVIESWIAGAAKQGGLGRTLAVYMICNKTALMAGQGLLSVWHTDSIALFLLVCACFSLSLVPVALTRTDPRLSFDDEKLGFRALYKIAPIGVVGCIGSGLINGSVQGLFPVYGLGIGLSATIIPMFLISTHLGSLACQWPLGWLSDRIDRRLVIVGASFVSALASLAMVFTNEDATYVLLGLFALSGAFSLSVYPICVAHASDFTSPSQLVALIASLLFSWSIGSVIGPPIATAVMYVSGPGGLLIYAATVAFSVGVFAAWRMTRRAPVPVEDRDAFINVPATSAVIAAMSAEVQRSDGDREANEREA